MKAFERVDNFALLKAFFCLNFFSLFSEFSATKEVTVLGIGLVYVNILTIAFNPAGHTLRPSSLTPDGASRAWTQNK